MLGVKNASLAPKSMELWYNELRVSDFDNKSSWAAIVNADANLADFADVSLQVACILLVLEVLIKWSMKEVRMK